MIEGAGRLFTVAPLASAALFTVALRVG